uniref:Uncharacterized protein n=1 Tax=Arundo donax TaxID=35708 RepID=A0A0A9A3Q5_ARUDO
MRLIGRKSFTDSTSLFLGSSVSRAVLSSCIFRKFLPCTAASAAIMSFLMIGQQPL